MSLICPSCGHENSSAAQTCSRCREILRHAGSAKPDNSFAEDEERKATRARWTLASIIIALAAGSIVYRLLVNNHLEQTSALFIGLPAILAILVARTSKAKSATGMIIKAMTLALLMSGILLGEGFICIVMAAPIFYLVAFIVGSIMDSAKRRGEENRRTRGLMMLPFLLLSMEGVHHKLSFPRAEIVVAEGIVEGNAAAVEEALSRTPHFDKTLPAYLRLGFPRPVATSGAGLDVGDVRRVRFAGGEGKPGDLVLEVAEHEAGLVRFRVVSDKSHISHWLDWREAEVRWTKIDEEHTMVRWSLRYDRQLDPAWYFAPWERYAAREAAGYLIDAAATPTATTIARPTMAITEPEEWKR
ncbi:MAG: hypothetical protein ACR2LC_14530 [Pyrinomonadaceae bacterium]